MAGHIKKAADDDDIDAIVLRVNSPGGSALASDIIWDAIVRAKAKKPIVVSMAGVAASGGYYISMAADSIFTGEGTITGSIGVIMSKPHIEEMMKDIDLGKDNIKRGKYAQMFTIERQWNESELELMNRSIDNTYDVFISKAAMGRGTSKEKIDSLGQGRVWSGSDALAGGLVDKIGGLWDAIRCAQRMAKIPLNENTKIEIFPKKKGFFEFLSELDSGIFSGILPSEIIRFMNIVRDNPDGNTGFIEGEALLLEPLDIRGEFQYRR
jgi:protease-4